MSNYQTQLNNLKNYLNTKGDFEIKIQPNDYPPLDNLFYEISHRNFVNTYINKFRHGNDLPKPPMLEDFIESVLEKNQTFKEYIEYFESTDRYKLQFLNSKTNQLDIIITHVDTNRKYVLTSSYNILQQKTPIYHLFREVTFKPINSKCKWVNNANPVMNIELNIFNKKPTPVALSNVIENELKFDTQSYVSYN